MCVHKNISSPVKEIVTIYPYRWTNQSTEDVSSTFNLLDDLAQDTVPLSSVYDKNRVKIELHLDQSSFYSPKVTKYIPRQIKTFAEHYSSYAFHYLMFVNLL